MPPPHAASRLWNASIGDEGALAIAKAASMNLNLESLEYVVELHALFLIQTLRNFGIQSLLTPLIPCSSSSSRFSFFEGWKGIFFRKRQRRRLNSCSSLGREGALPIVSDAVSAQTKRAFWRRGEFRSNDPTQLRNK